MRRTETLRAGDQSDQVSELAAPVPAPDGSMLYEFDRYGRHMRTVDFITHHELVSFAYNADGRLATVFDTEGQPTSIA